MKLQELLETLRSFGAPVGGVRSTSHLPLEEAVVEATIASKDSASLLRMLPVLLVRRESELDIEKLRRLADAAGVSAELGMLFELSGTLSGHERLIELAETISSRPDGGKPTPYLRKSTSAGLELARTRTPPAVRRWGFLLNMDEESFRTALTRAMS